MIESPQLEEIRQSIREKNDSVAERREGWIQRNPYYYGEVLRSLRFIIPAQSKVLHIRCSTGFLLNELQPTLGVGVDDSERQIELARKHYPHLVFHHQSPELPHVEGVFDYIIVSSIEDIVDLKAVLDALKKNADRRTRFILVHYNFLWHPLVQLAEALRLKIPQRLHNWLSLNDVYNLLRLSHEEPVHTKKIVLFPFFIPIFSYLLNRFVARLPFFRGLTMTRLTVARMLDRGEKDYSVSVVIPCKDEAGNVESAVLRIPEMGLGTEIIFGDDQSTDGTKEKILEMIKKYPDRNIKVVDSPGISKAENVWTCFDRAGGDILMVLDADLTVIPEELPYFYEAIAQNYGEFINGSRLVYPMHREAMKIVNMLGNKFFSTLFSYILDTTIKDTLCGTKVLWRRDYECIKKLRGSWGIQDRWGDYELIFGAAKRHLKIVDLPVHYMERTYGETKMTNRFRNGWIMLRMCLVSLLRIKFY
ncbi:MAG TPA: bifunctional class I SAM-dependent methyltransferase/glycosyltransferase family 2 protein [Bacteroidota bacterium]|nr:bifunctional class I SAM-dependent methyltransferase/glycosyltransferase family 2 protein [Bacteroidota bacterium]